ncbi:penicillin-binding protein 1A [Ectothiorhodospira variabilis]|uniref:penicillin-binding protein 1A n=1 Tax=Ectothiorhodospira variabilis TaxID=505694 RepID=UPI001EFB8253|nr:penicillin-binding protein 1A [Ectothiorhodospira variabilis]MCG5493532.1 penicillin-binding protein 1A [Ectothiorhodospira variabilis]MCG5502861.1 penicillin-binding protein 1A [Ectothiorhodospira variabilis]MCG5506351.1 penicillin-binding protein 1A [Ectothiorhodospira variabilis]
MKFFLVSLRVFFSAALAALTLGVLVVAGAYVYVAPQMPEVDGLRDVQLQVPLRVFTRDGELMAEYGEQRREPVSVDEVPELMRLAFLAAEDERFEEHPGVDVVGLTRAAVNLISTREKTQGGSTITMQVARNFFLDRDKTYTRKITEIFVAMRIERELSKDEILELYLNKIFLGQRAYGVGAAAQIYYGKALDELTLPQIAMIAGLPQAPSAANPVTNPRRATARRNYVLGRMHDLGYISTEDFEAARQAPITARLHSAVVEVSAGHVAEMVRMEMVARYGEAAYEDGYRVYTTLDRDMQEEATRALRRGLITYDRRHGYRGPEAEVDLDEYPDEAARDRLLAGHPRAGGGLLAGLVTQVSSNSATVYVGQGEEIELNLAAMEWARPYIDASRVGNAPQRVSQVVSPGHVIRVMRGEGGEGWSLAQVPAVEGAIVALDPEDGAVRALVGGYDFFRSNFNRAVRAERQPGSAFKPFIYSAGLAHGHSPASVFNDAPVVVADISLDGDWRPRNYSGRFYGPTRLREALAHSRNLVSIRLLDEVGVERTLDFLGHFGFERSRHPSGLSLALGSGSVTPLELTRGFAVFANGGYRVDPWFLDRIEDPYGEVVFRTVPRRVCPPPCQVPAHPDGDLVAVEGAALDGSAAGTPAFVPAERTLPATNVYQMVSMLQDVITSGTGRRATALGRDDLAGKTGTTNDLRDAWFSGFNGDLVTSVWVGFDGYSSLGRRETGASAALPVWVDFMGKALEGRPERLPEEPRGMVTVRIDAETGKRVTHRTQRAIFETFTQDQLPHLGVEERSGPSRDEVTPDQIF